MNAKSFWILVIAVILFSQTSDEFNILRKICPDESVHQTTLVWDSKTNQYMWVGQIKLNQVQNSFSLCGGG